LPEDIERRARIPSALLELGLRNPGAVLLFWGLMLLAALPGVTRLQVDTSTDSVLDRRHPDWQRYQDSQRRFGGDELIVIALFGDLPYDPDRLADVERLSRSLAKLPGVRRVDSLATVPVVYASPDGSVILDAPLERAPSDPAGRSAWVSERVAGDRIAPRNLVSDDGRVLAINLVLERGIEANHAQLLEEIHAQIDGSDAILSGVPVFRVEANARTGQEILFFLPITAALIGVFLFLLFGSFHAVLLDLAPGLIGSWLVLGAMGYLGAPLSITTIPLPSIVTALGCAYAMHFLAAANGARDPRELADQLRRVVLPVALSGLTTVVGFVSITVVGIDAVRSIGGYGALGVLLVTLISLTLLPAALAVRRVPDANRRGLGWIREQLSPWLVARVSRSQRAIIAAWTALTLLLAFGLTRIDVETDATLWLPHGNPVRDSYEDIRRALSGISPINLIVEAPAGGSVLEPRALAAIDALSTHMESLPQVGRTLSLTDPLRQLNGGLLGDDAMPLPRSLSEAAQFLVLLDGVEQLSDFVSLDRRSANVHLRVNDNGSSQLLAVAEEARRWWSENGPPDYTLAPTGIMYEFARAEDEIAYGQIRGLAIALLVISGILFAIFRWSRLALAALVPNAIPLVTVFGGMGLLGVPLDAGTVLIGGLALGVAVDDTIHIASGYYKRIAQGEKSLTAVTGTFEEVLPAIISTTVMISGSFVVLGLSEFSITRNLGLMTSGIMVLCLLADVTLLAVLLLRMRPGVQSDGTARTPSGPRPS
jgi:hypothetical protein